MRTGLSRRSFLAQVIGASALVGCAPIASDRTAERRQTRMLIDRDPSDPARPIARRSRMGAVRPGPVEASNTSTEAEPRVQGTRGFSLSGPLERFITCPGHHRCPR
jgi:hypothetical protein